MTHRRPPLDSSAPAPVTVPAPVYRERRRAPRVILTAPLHGGEPRRLAAFAFVRFQQRIVKADRVHAHAAEAMRLRGVYDAEQSAAAALGTLVPRSRREQEASQ